MMAAFVRKNLPFFVLNRSRSPVSSSLSLHFCSSATETRPGISPTISDILLHKYDFPPELVSRVASRLTLLQHPEKANLVLSFFLETGFSSDDICKILTKNPAILSLSLNKNIVPSLNVLMGLLGSIKKVDRVIMKYPRILTSNLENTVLQNVEFLKGFGIPNNRICSVLCSHPTIFTTTFESVKKAAEKAKEMGLDTRSDSFIYAIITFVSMSDGAWEAKLQAFRDLGFSDRDISTMFMKAPIVFCVSMKKIKSLIELLLATRRFDLSSVVNHPFSLQGSIEKRYKPRLWILGILESRGLIKEWPILSKLRQLTDDEFFDEFIRPYPDVVSNVDIITGVITEG